MDEPPVASAVGDLPAAFAAALSEAKDLGIVQLTEAGMFDWGHWEALQVLRDHERLPVRVRVLVASGAADLDRMRRTEDGWLDLLGVKFYADGWLGPRTCACSRPFADRPGDTGVLFMEADLLAKRITPYVERGWTIATHAIGDRAIESVLDAYHRVFGAECARASPRIEHAQVLRADLIDRMAAMGVVVCIQPSFAFSDAETIPAALGDDFPLAYRWDCLLEAGVRVIAGSDYPIETQDPQVGLERLTSGKHPLTEEQALRIMTAI